MSVPSFPTVDGSVSSAVNPYRPGFSDVGGASFVDDTEFAPDPNTQLTAAVENQNESLMVAAWRVLPVGVFYVKNSGTPSIFGIRTASGLLSSSDFTVNDLGTGKTEIKCPATKMIQPLLASATVQATGGFMVSAYVNGTSDGIVIETRNAAGTAVDCDFAALWY